MYRWLICHTTVTPGTNKLLGEDADFNMFSTRMAALSTFLYHPLQSTSRIVYWLNFHFISTKDLHLKIRYRNGILTYHSDHK